MSDTCQSCATPIVWAKSATGRPMPMERDVEGRWVVTAGVAERVARPEPSDPRERYSSHFATCPLAAHWRGRQRGAVGALVGAGLALVAVAMLCAGVVLNRIDLARAEAAEAKAIAERALALWPRHLDCDTALANVRAAEGAATADAPADLLIAIARVESGFRPDSVSRLIVGDAKRTTGRWPSLKAPKGWRGSLFCGVTQATASTWPECLALRDLGAAYSSTAAQLGRWLKRTGGDLVLALAGYACGNKGAATGRCNGYPGRVLGWMRRLSRRTT